MCELFSKYEKEIEQYCIQNHLDFETAKNLPKCWGKNDIYLQYHNIEKGKKGLLDETPADIVLMIFIKNEKLTFEQTEFTEKYLKKIS